MSPVSYTHLKPLMADLKRVYAAPTEEIARAELDGFDEKWSGKMCIRDRKQSMRF